jgi:hypothetical protein
MTEKTIAARILRSDKDLIDQLPGDSFQDKLHDALSRGNPGGDSATPLLESCSNLHSLGKVSSINAEIAPGPQSDSFQGLEDCRVRDSDHNRCLRHSPKKTYRIDFPICQSCQFRGLHYPERLQGITPRENAKVNRKLEILERREAIEQMKLEQEIEKTSRKPTQVLYHS